MICCVPIFHQIQILIAIHLQYKRINIWRSDVEIAVNPSSTVETRQTPHLTITKYKLRHFSNQRRLLPNTISEYHNMTAGQHEIQRTHQMHARWNRQQNE